MQTKALKRVRFRHSFDARGNYLGCVREDLDKGRWTATLISILFGAVLLFGFLELGTVAQHFAHGKTFTASVSPP